MSAHNNPGGVAMIQMGTMLSVADNSGARRLQAIRQLGGQSVVMNGDDM